jgi:hypothetical protein
VHGQNSRQASGRLSSEARQARHCARVNRVSEAKGPYSIGAPSLLSNATTARHSSRAAKRAGVSKPVLPDHPAEPSAANRRGVRQGDLQERNSPAGLRQEESSAPAHPESLVPAPAARSSLAGIESANNPIRAEHYQFRLRHERSLDLK